MGVYTDWFLADESEAEAVASIASDEGHGFEDWPHLALKGVAETELMLLRGVLLGRPGDLEEAGGDALFVEEDEEDGGGVLVRRVHPELIDDLASLTDEGIRRVAAVWGHCDTLTDWTPDDVVTTLTEMVGFARRATEVGKPVLEFTTW